MNNVEQFSLQEFGIRLEDLRTERGLTREEMANMLNISYSAYTNYENAKREPNFETIVKLADFFQVSVDYLLGRVYFKDNEYYKQFIQTQQILENENALKESYKNIYENMVKAFKNLTIKERFNMMHSIDLVIKLYLTLSNIQNQTKEYFEQTQMPTTHRNILIRYEEYLRQEVFKIKNELDNELQHAIFSSYEKCLELMGTEKPKTLVKGEDGIYHVEDKKIKNKEGVNNG